MDSLFVIMIFAVMLLPFIFWWAIVIWVARRAWSQIQTAMKQQLSIADRNLREFASLPPAERAQREAQVLATLSQVNNHMLALNNQMRQRATIRQQSHEVFVGQLQGMAASAGLNWSPPT